MRKGLYIIPVLILFLAALIMSACQSFLPHILSAIFSRQLRAEVKIDKASCNFINGIIMEDIHISNKKGLSCNIENAAIRNISLSVNTKTGRKDVFLCSGLGFELEGVEFLYPGSAVVNSIADAISLKQPGMLSFDTASGRLYRRDKELVVESWSAFGRHIRLFVDGAITDDSRINASFRILLSEGLVAGIPQAARRLFFKQDGLWSMVELYLSGDIQHPSINFSTNLFRLIVR